MTPWKILAPGCMAWLAAAPQLVAQVDYLRDVKPVLTQHCYRCHGASQQKADLRVDTAAFLKAGGAGGPTLTPAKTAAETMLLQVILGTHEDIAQMPYKKPAMSDAEIAVVRAWIEAGAPAPEQEEPEKNLHWSFVAPVRVEPPAVKRTDWARNPIDRFILARLETDGIAPAPEADRITQLRRLSLDLLGLPPTPAEVTAFLADQKADAYERATERLLGSPHFGERWARPWLDVARYADSNGYSIDAPRQIWKYRDWVINALNRDQPFDQFVIEQLAGDLLPEPTFDQRTATGFNRNTQINQEGGIDPEQFRIEAVMDRVNTFGTAFLGLTVGCAQCHDHKFDPIKQREYFQLFAFFNNTVDDGHGKSTPGGTLEFPHELEPQDGLVRELAEARSHLEQYLNGKGSEVGTWATALTPEARAKLRPIVRDALPISWDKQTEAQRRAVYGAFNPADKEFSTRLAKVTRLERNERKPVSTLVMSELPAPRQSHLFIKGDFTRLGEKVNPGTPAILPPLTAEKPTRLDLARWVTDPANPLAGRVIVNRIWQQYFGRGLVETENDFGTQGSPPTHPELLDWLATELVAQQWSQKAIHRLIVNSATYRQSSRARSDLDIKDPINKLLARQSRLRLDAELVRDVALTASGVLNPKLGGPPVFPPQPEGVMNLGQVRRAWQASTGGDRNRRALYTHLWRATPHPALAVFDEPDAFSACTRRLRSNTPLQALTLLNDQQFYEFAEALAARIEREGPPELAARLDYAFRLCVARPPNPAERSRLAALHAQQIAAATGDDTAKSKAAWITIARVLLNLDETITRE